VLQPENYAALQDRLGRVAEKNVKTIAAVSAELQQRLADDGIAAEVSSRLKSPWSIFSKIERRSIALEQLSDMIGFRVIVDCIEDCYKTLGIVHTTWKVVPGRFKDYISVPKYNDYRSIHTTIVGPGRQRVELQIRTREMNEIAEYGIAAHALYKDNVEANIQRLEKESRAYVWLRSMIANLTAGSSTEEFLEYTKLELFQDQVFCFTPRGRLIALPRSATPIDFAYAVHTELGDTCVGAKINGSIVPLVTQLRSGDEVEIITDQSHVPPANWESIAATGKARAAIRRAVRAAGQQRALALGEHVLEVVLQREGVTLDDTELAIIAEQLGQPGRRELVIAIGENRVQPEALGEAAASLKGVRRRHRRKMDLPVADQADGWFALRNSELFKFRIPGGQKLGASGKAALSKLDFNMAVRVSPEGVVPGDRIIGILTPGGDMTIYPVHSDALVALYDSDVAWIDVRWDIGGRDERFYKVAISMLSLNKPGAMAQISSAIAACDANIHNLVMQMVSPDFHRLVFEIEVRDLPQLSDVLSALKRTTGLSAVRRASVAEGAAISRIDWAMPVAQEAFA